MSPTPAKLCLANAQALGSTPLVVVGAAWPRRRCPQPMGDDRIQG